MINTTDQHPHMVIGFSFNGCGAKQKRNEKDIFVERIQSSNG